LAEKSMLEIAAARLFCERAPSASSVIGKSARRLGGGSGGNGGGSGGNGGGSGGNGRGGRE